MKKFTLLQLFPVGWNQSGNRALADFICSNISMAIVHFKFVYPEVNLDADGYSKEGDCSFCVVEEFNPCTTNNS